MHYAFAGNIASGKSACAQLLSERLDLPLVQERVTDHPFLARFYSDPKQWAFHLQMFNIGDRSQAILASHRRGDFVVDRSFEEDVVYVQSARSNGVVTAEEFGIYQRLFEVALLVVPPPKMMFYLRADDVSILVERIRDRSREVESGINSEYLLDLQAKYDTWFDLYPEPKHLIDVSHGSPAAHADVVMNLLR